MRSRVHRFLDEQYFVVNYASFGLTKEEPLCPSGDQIKLNEENKNDYVEKYISWRFNKGNHGLNLYKINSIYFTIYLSFYGLPMC